MKRFFILLNIVISRISHELELYINYLYSIFRIDVIPVVRANMLRRWAEQRG